MPEYLLKLLLFLDNGVDGVWMDNSTIIDLKLQYAAGIGKDNFEV